MMLIISSLVYRFVEEPARRKLRPKRDTRPAPVAETVPANETQNL
jgi:peptidoglycan/LPS O-acetylase OafA/YrhL